MEMFGTLVLIGVTSGVLVANPIPEAAALDEVEVSEAIAIAIVVRIFDRQDVLILGSPNLVGEELVIDVVLQRR